MEQLSTHVGYVDAVNAYSEINSEDGKYDFSLKIFNVDRDKYPQLLDWIGSIDFSEYVETFVKHLKGELHQDIKSEDQPFTKFYYNFDINSEVSLETATGYISKIDENLYNADWRAFLVTDKRIGRASLITASVRLEKLE